MKLHVILLTHIILSIGLHAAPSLEVGKNSLNQLFALNIAHAGLPIKLHLGCGQVYRQSYINIDFPLSEHTIQKKSVADVFCDITRLKFPACCLQEIRSHHIFEHFFRQTALALLCAWNNWLCIGGTLCIETPDFDTCIKKLASCYYSYSQKELIKRHVFGSHEASWAVHCDGWGKEKFEHILRKLGFSEISFEYNNELLSNITVYAKKIKILSAVELKAAAYEILKDCQNGSGDVDMWQLWCNQFGEQLQAMII